MTTLYDDAKIGDKIQADGEKIRNGHRRIKEQLREAVETERIYK